ncbi:hypothetical protein [Tateyamaria sp.]|uniref:hypothetical protein n=1 Tax=Tateyamaria sp. TaxID=1929288 RepID=UPI00329E9ED5
MPLYKYDIALAAQMISSAYYMKKSRGLKPHVREYFDENHVQAIYLKQDILLIPGSNSVSDYLMFNLRVLNFGGKKYRLNDTDTETDQGAVWHQGFLKHAKGIADWIDERGYKPKFIVGHSLGAAATQILVRNWGVPGIAFAAPRPLRSATGHDHHDLCLCLNRRDDRVCDLPASFGHMGHVHSGGTRAFLRFDHKMKHYRTMVAEQQAMGKLGKMWPE